MTNNLLPPSAYPRLKKPEYFKIFDKKPDYKLSEDQRNSMRELIYAIKTASASFHELNQLLNEDMQDPYLRILQSKLPVKLNEIEQQLALASKKIYESTQAIDDDLKKNIIANWKAYNEDYHKHSKAAEIFKIIYDLFMIALSLAVVALGIALTVGVSLATPPIGGMALLGAVLIIPFEIIVGTVMAVMFAYSVKTNIRFLQDKQFQEIDTAINLITNFRTLDIVSEEEELDTSLKI